MQPTPSKNPDLAHAPFLHSAAGMEISAAAHKHFKLLVSDFGLPGTTCCPMDSLMSPDGKYIVDRVHGPAQTREILSKHTYDCLLLDGASNFEAALSLLSSLYDEKTHLPPLPVVMVLDHLTNNNAMLMALRAGAQDCIAHDDLRPEILIFSVLKAREFFTTKTNHQLAELQLQQLRRMEAIGQLTSGVAHDLNNLLTVVLGNTRLLRRRIERNPESFSLSEADHKIESIEIAATKGADLVRRMMVFTRQSQLTEEIVTINTCVDEIFELLKRTLGELIQIDIIHGEKLWPVSVDVREFENALINLAVNARDAMPRGGRLTIETGNVVLDESYSLAHPDAVPGPYVFISVSDTGTGIEPSIMARIFEPFFTTKQAGQGTGLGLSMVYGFIRQSKGHIHAYSEPGHGTVFRIYLPRVRLENEETEALTEVPVASGKETILVVEDDDDVRFMACAMLEKLGYQTMHASTAKGALEIIKRQHKKIDLVFTDIVMPGGMTGIELVQRLREYYPAINVLYTSGYSANAIPDYQLSVGEELISKPYRREVLAAKLRQILDQRNSVDEDS